MRIVIDGRWIGRTGIGRYSSELLNELQKEPTNHEYVVLLLPEQFEVWQPTNPRFTKALTNSEVYSLAEQLILPFEIRRHKPDLVHFHAFNLPVLYFGRYVTTIHDLTLLRHLNLRGSGLAKWLYLSKRQIMKFILWNAVHRSKQLLAPSEYTKDVIVDRYRIPRSKVKLTYLGVGGAIAAHGSLERFELPNTFVLYVGNYYPYKQVRELVEAFAKSEFRRAGGSLVLNGKPDYFQNLVRARVEELQVQDKVIFPGYTTDEELAYLYHKATLFVFPSISEGFGLNGLEAMAHSVPVLAAYASCLPEIYEDAAAYFDPNKPGDLTRQMDLLIYDDSRRSQLIAKGRRQVKKFEWARTAELTHEVYDQLDSGRNR